MPVGPFELIILLFLVLLFFGAKRLPEMGRSLGTSMHEFKEGISSDSSEDQEREKPALEEPRITAGQEAGSSDRSATR